MKHGVFKYIFILAFIVLLIVTYVVFYDKDSNQNKIQDQTSTTTVLITDLRLGIAEFDTMNPLISNNKNVKEISRLIFDSLVTIKNDYSIEYSLATEIVKSDDLTYLIKLRNNVKWQDGSDFTSQDVKFTVDVIKNALGNSAYASNLQYVSALEAIDNNTIKIYLSEPVEFFEYNLTFPILSKNYFENEDFFYTEKNDYIIGTGMFKIEERSEGIIRLAKNENYWNKNKNSLLTSINITCYANMGDMYTAFKTGYIDIMDISINNIQSYIGSLGYTKVDYPDRTVSFLAFNTQNELFLDTNTRKAIALLLDKNNILANLGNGYFTTNFIYPDNNWLFDSMLKIEYNSELADSLLTQAGWVYTNNTWIRNGRVLSFSIKVNENYPDRVIAANIIAEQLRNHGIEVNVLPMQNGAYENDFNIKNYEVILTGLKMGYSPKVTALFSDDNIANYYNENVSNIIKNIKSTTDNTIQKENYNRLYEQYINDFPYIFLYRETDSVVYNQTLCGKISPNAYSIFYNIDKWYRQ